MRQDSRTSGRWACALVAAVCVLAMSFATNLPAGWGASTSHSMTLQSVTDTAHLHFVRESGSDLLEEGAATGGLPGKLQVRLNVGATVYGSFTIQTHYGSISGTGSGKLHGTGTYASFGGSMDISHGTGRYAHAHGHGGFYGTLNRNTYAATIQTTGTLVY
jgi:hypothetical protein